MISPRHGPLPSEMSGQPNAKLSPSRPDRWWQDGSLFFYGLFLVELARLFFLQLQAGYSKESNNVTEWLINYQGGFVRRGLPGEVFYQASRLTGVSPYYFLLALCLAAYAGLAVYFYRAFRRHGLSTWLLPFTFLLGGPIINNFWFRKDALMILLFIAILKLLVSNRRWALAGANVLFVVGLLTHESIGFYGFPMVLLLVFHHAKRSGRANGLALGLATLQVLPALAAFAAVLGKKGSLLTAEKVWDSWRTIRFPLQNEAFVQPAGSVDALSWSLGKGLAFTRNTLINFNDGIYAPLALFIAIVVIYFVVTNFVDRPPAAEGETGPVLASSVQLVFSLQLAGVALLFVLGWDYGRWVFLWICSSFAIHFVVPARVVGELFPARFKLATVGVLNFPNRLFHPALRRSRLLPFLLGMPGASWSLASYVDTTPAYLSLHLISALAQKLLSVLLHKHL